MAYLLFKINLICLVYLAGYDVRMKNTLKHLYHTLCLSALVIVLLLALVLSVMRAVTPWLANQRDMVERWASQLLAQPVEMQTFTIHWRGLRPVLQGKQVVIWNVAHTRPLLKVDELDVGLNVLASLASGQFKLARVSVVGAHLTIEQTADGAIHINGINNLLPSTVEGTSIGGLDEFLHWLFNESYLSLENINLTWYDKTGKVLPITNLNLTLKNQLDTHLFAGNAELAQQIPSTINFVIEVHGRENNTKKMRAKIYLDAQNVVLTQWLPPKWQDYQIKDGIADFRVWADWSHNQLQNVQSLLAVNKLEFSTANNTITLQPFAMNLLWQLQADNTWEIAANFRDVGFNRWEKTPGMTGLTGYIHLTPSTGSLDLNSEQVTADFGALFKAPLKFDALSGHFNWEKSTEGWLIQGAQLQATNTDINALADFNLWLPTDNSGAVIQLLANTHANSVKHIGNYLPLTIMQPSLVHWLSHAITYAESGDATTILNGRLADFPFDNLDGTFLIHVDVKNADVDYWPGWIPAKQANAELMFAGRRMDIQVNRAQILQTPIQNIQLSIPILKHEVQAVLSMNGNIAGELAQGWEFLHASPMHEKLGGSLQDVMLTGPMQLQMQLAVPLEEGSVPLSVKGQITTQNAELAIKNRNVRLTDLQGVLDFTQDTLVAPNLTANLWDKPIKIALDSKPNIRLQMDYAGSPFTLLQNPRGWLLQLRNKQMQGDVLIPNQHSQPLDVRFSRIYIDPDKTNTSDLKPSQIPAVNFFARTVRYGNKNLGLVKFLLRPTDEGSVRILEMRAGPANGQLTAEGLWSLMGTTLNGTVVSQNVAQFLKNISFPASITGVGKLDFKLHWPVAFNNLNLKQMNGSMHLLLKQGQIVDIGASASAQMNLGRLLTSLSFQSLGRRFTSRSAVGAQGFEFDEMRGDFALKNGRAFTENLFLDGPVAQINLNGSVGLVMQDYDLLLRVVPHITSSLPIVAGLVAANPIVGAGVFVANAVLGSTVQEVAASQYRLTGTWSQPVIKEM